MMPYRFSLHGFDPQTHKQILQAKKGELLPSSPNGKFKTLLSSVNCTATEQKKKKKEMVVVEVDNLTT